MEDAGRMIRTPSSIVRFVLLRAVSAALTIIGAMVLLFLLVKLVPGDFASILLGPRATPELRAQINMEMGLDRSLPAQIWLFLSHAVAGNFGVDVVSRRPIIDIVLELLPNTLILAFSALGLSLVSGIFLGVVAALKHGSWFDTLLGVISVSFITTPSMVVSIFLLLIFSLALHWLPVSGAGVAGDATDQLRHLVLPCLALALGWVGYISRLVRASLLEVLSEHHVRTLRAYGTPEWRIVGKYALRLALVPLVSILGLGLGDLIGSSVFAEVIFARPGLGSLIFNSIASRNYPVVQACVLLIVIIYVIANFVVDVINSRLDPRIARSLNEGQGT
jgi:peptide/nickel transport system permease protein